MKSILRGFESVSGLNVNLFKSCLYAVNVDEDFLSVASAFLCCKAGSLPFSFLGIPVGCNHRTQSPWKSLVQKLKNKLSVWKGRFLYIGGKITLINSILNSIPIYFLSFYKIPKIMLQQLIKIQRNFLWSSGADSRGISRVGWFDMCRSREAGGLGIKFLTVFNESLMCKWKWRFLTYKDTIWRPILEFRYGALTNCVLSNVSHTAKSKSFLWWRDIITTTP